MTEQDTEIVLADLKERPGVDFVIGSGWSARAFSVTDIGFLVRFSRDGQPDRLFQFPDDLPQRSGDPRKLGIWATLSYAQTDRSASTVSPDGGVTNDQDGPDMRKWTCRSASWA